MRPFKAKFISDTSHYSKIVHYTHANPVHHGLVPNISDWAYSSYNTLKAYSMTHLERQYVLNWFGNRKQFIAFHGQFIGIKKDGNYEESNMIWDEP